MLLKKKKFYLKKDEENEDFVSVAPEIFEFDSVQSFFSSRIFILFLGYSK